MLPTVAHADEPVTLRASLEGFPRDVNRLPIPIGPRTRAAIEAAIGHADTRDGSGTFTQFAASIGRTFHISHWMTAWISLDVGPRRWRGQPPPNEADGHQFMLTIGTTFR